MSALDDLKDRIDSAIYTNTEQNITGDGLQTVLDDMVDTMGVSVSQNTSTPQQTDLSIGPNSIDVARKRNIVICNEANEDVAISGYISNNTGVIVTQQGDLYRVIKMYLDSGDYYIRISKPGTQQGMWKYTDGTFATPSSAIIGNQSFDGIITLTAGYYALSYNSSNENTNYYDYPILCVNMVNASRVLEDGSVTTPKLADDAVTTPKIKDFAVSGNKLELNPIYPLYGKRLVDSSDFTQGGRINNQNEVVSDEDWEYTENYYKVSAGEILYLHNFQNDNSVYSVLFYDITKTSVLGGVSYELSSDKINCVTVPNACAFARFSRLITNDIAFVEVRAIYNTSLINNTNYFANKYLKEDGTIGDADLTYGLAKIFIANAGLYYIKAANSHPVLGKTDSTFEESTIILSGSTTGELLWLDSGYYVFCWGGKTPIDTAFNPFDKSYRFEAVTDISQLNDILGSNPFKNYINPSNISVREYIADTTGTITVADYVYRLIKVYISQSGKYWLKTSGNTHPVMWKYSNIDYDTPVSEIVGANSDGFDGILELTQGYYAICYQQSGSTEDYMPVEMLEQYLYKVDEFAEFAKAETPQNRINFFSLGNKDLTLAGTSTVSNGIITLASGFENRAYLNNGLEGAHWEMSAKFKCSGGVSFIMGKDDSTYGAWIEFKKDNGDSIYTLYNNGASGQQYTGNLDFSLNEGEIYTLRVFFDVTITKIIGFEIFGQYNEYFTYTFSNVTCNAYGLPFFYSNVSCVVYESAISVQNYYDIKTAKAGVWGHSYVEGDTLGSDRDKTFTNLLANALGATKVFNFGLGGDTWQGVRNKMGNEMGFASNIQYALICCGANDIYLTLNEAKAKINSIVSLLRQNNIEPIIFTIAPIGTNGWYKQNWVDTNAWIRATFKYVDMEQVFLSVDATGSWSASDVRTDLYLSDNVHPNVAGHAAIFKRIQMDCPFLF